MVYGAILEKGEAWYTDMSRVFDAIHGKQREYNWLITNMDFVPEEIIKRCKGADYCWLTGEELSRIVQEADHSQWVWAVLSGFDLNISLQEVLKYPMPYADGYKGFWRNPITMQHPLAAMEIVAWDGMLTLFFSRQEALVQDFLHFFPLSENLLSFHAR